MNRNEMIFGKLLPALMLVTVFATGCGSSVSEMAERATEAVSIGVS